MNETTATIIRSVLKVGAAALATKGVLTSDAAETAVGAIVALIGVIWGIIAARKAAAAKKELGAG